MGTLWRLAREVASVLGVEVAVENRDLALEHLYEFETKGEPGDWGAKRQPVHLSRFAAA